MKHFFWFLSNCNVSSPATWGVASKTHLDMGCGRRPRNPFGAVELIGLDLFEDNSAPEITGFKYIRVKSDAKIPLENNSVDSISGFDFIEHLSRGVSLETNLFIQFMNEAHRVLRDSGVLLLVTPAFPSPAAFQDPTHINFITELTITYFTGSEPGASSLGYGFIGRFEIINHEWVGPLSKVWEISPGISFRHNLFYTLWRLLLEIRSVKGLRRFISQIRKPTHLMWFIKKIP